MDFQSREDYHQYLQSIGRLPEGFLCRSAAITFKAKEDPHRGQLPMNLSLLQLNQPTDSFAAVFTSNSFVGAPVTLGRKLLGASELAGVFINNKISNVGVKSGLEDSQTLLAEVEKAAGLPQGTLVPSSTGVIGWSLPLEDMLAGLPALVQTQPSKNLFPLSRGIMTTDAYPKMARFDHQGGSILATAKGAGMIEPNMATMLAFITTDFEVPRRELQELLQEVVNRSFNAITVDGDQSTSDMVWAFSSKSKAYPGREVLRQGLMKVCQDLAIELVRNGEGTSHVMELKLQGARTVEAARVGAKGVLNSPLVKTAVYGNDPNVGRILGALGDALGGIKEPLDGDKIVMQLGGMRIYENGAFTLDPVKEKNLSAYLKDQSFPEISEGYPYHNRRVELEIDLGMGGAAFTAWGSDLTHQYINENADYRS
jgi:glutamate N-acetyltransferase/amino-acid N-acetyltransferase